MRDIINYDHRVTASKTVNLSNPPPTPCIRIFNFGCVEKAHFVYTGGGAEKGI